VNITVLTLNIETPDGRLPQAKVRIPDLPLRMADLVPPMQRLCDGIVELAIQREKEKGESISCHKGCENGVCCSQLVPLSPPEAFFLRDFIQTLPPERKTQIESHFNLVKEAMDQRGLTEKIRGIEHTHEHQLLAYEYFRMGMPCPFLEGGSCSIYSIRPFACREYNIVHPRNSVTIPSKKEFER
jgi:Fe-S-cluster containining protein